MKNLTIFILTIFLCSPVLAKDDQKLTGEIYYDECLSNSGDKRGKDRCESYFQGLLSGVIVGTDAALKAASKNWVDDKKPYEELDATIGFCLPKKRTLQKTTETFKDYLEENKPLLQQWVGHLLQDALVKKFPCD